MDKFKIREYSSKDKLELLRLLKLNVPKYFAESEINDLNEYLEYKIESYFVIETENEIIGAGGINFDKEHEGAKLSWDFVHPEFQGKRAGQQLLKHRIGLLKSMEITNISVRTSQFAYTFYEKNRFVLRNKVKDYWDTGFDLYEMSYPDDEQ